MTNTTETPTSPLTTVVAIYEAFGRGDVATVLGLLTDDVRFDAEEPVSAAADRNHPLLRPHRGKAEVADFFAELARCEMHRFEVVDLLTSETQVAAQIRISFTTPAGGTIDDDEMHRWTFSPDGRVSSLRHYVDTAQHLAAWFPAS